MTNTAYALLAVVIIETFGLLWSVLLMHRDSKKHAADLESVRSLAESDRASYQRAIDELVTALMNVDAAIASVYGVKLHELIYNNRVEAIADLRRKGAPKLRAFNWPTSSAPIAEPFSEATTLTETPA